MTYTREAVPVIDRLKAALIQGEAIHPDDARDAIAALEPKLSDPFHDCLSEHGTVAADYFITCRCDVKGPGNDPDDHHMMCPLTNSDYWQAAHANALLDEIEAVLRRYDQFDYESKNGFLANVKRILSKRVKP